MHARADHPVDRFVLELLSTGSVLCNLVSDLIDALPVGACPGEEPESVAVEMLCGTIRTTLGSADPQDGRRATGLIDLAGARTLEHLQPARDLSRPIHRDGEDAGCLYG